MQVNKILKLKMPTCISGDGGAMKTQCTIALHVTECFSRSEKLS